MLCYAVLCCAVLIAVCGVLWIQTRQARRGVVLAVQVLVLVVLAVRVALPPVAVVAAAAAMRRRPVEALAAGRLQQWRPVMESKPS
jgi:O-antigen ligase